jgi:ferric-dicitrate binding protein FerR (iron transport regulator)
VLADSSLVFLNANTVLKYHPDNCRELWLKGEGFFEVKPPHRTGRHNKTVQNEAVPFIVHAGMEKIVVLGTSFTVKTIHDAARVVLLNGKVKASVGQKTIVMNPGEKVEWKGDHFFKEKVNPQLYIAWKDGEFHFDHTSLKELTEVVKYIYGYDMIIKDPASLPVKYISGRISSENEEMLWNSLSVLLNVRVIKHNKQIILVPE